MAGRPHRPARSGPRRGRRAATAAGAAALVVAVAVAGEALVGSGPPAPPEDAEIKDCNGLRALCDRRLDEVVLPGNHNSNHWIDRFPPSENRRAGDRRTLLRRVRACRERMGRVPNLIAVDFYERGDVIGTARELNRDGAAVREDG
jgi:hypothetical protein